MNSFVKKFSAFGLALLMGFGFLMMSQEADAQRRSAKYHRHKRTSRHMSNFTQRIKFPRSKRYISVGGGVGITNYLGDIVPNTSAISTDLRMTRWNLHAFAEKKMNYNMSIRLGLQFARLSGSDYRSGDPQGEAEELARWGRNLHFRNDVIEFSAVGVFDLYSSTGNVMNRHPFIPYGILGVALFYHNPKAVAPAGTPDAGNWVALHDLETESDKSYSLIQPAIPAGVGIKYRAAHKLDLAFEIGYRFTFFDYLDDVGGQYHSVERMRELAQGSEEDVIALKLSNRTYEPDDYTSYNTVVSHLNGDQIERESTNMQTFAELQSPQVLTDANGQPISMNGDEQFLYANGSIEDQAPRGNPDNDFYIVTNISVRYILGSFSNRRPKYR